MKLVIEIDPDRPEEIVIRAHRSDERLRALAAAVERAVSDPGEIALRSGEGEVFIKTAEILFCEVAGERLWVHTARDVYESSGRLYELEAVLPRYFVRAGKGALVNVRQISSISRSPTGVGEVRFFSSEKKTYISRRYYKVVRDEIEEERLRT